MKFDYDFEKFFPINDNETDFFFDYRDKFESDNDFLLIAIENNSGVFEKEFLEDVHHVTKKLEKSKYVQFVTSITTMEEQFFHMGGGTTKKKYIDFSKYERERDSVRVFEKDEIINSLVAEDGKSICLFVRHEDFLSKKKSDELIIGIEKLLTKKKFDNYRLAGRSIGQQFYIDKMSTEMLFFVGLSAVLIVFFLFIAFKSAWGILIPQVVIVGGMVWVIGGMGLFNEPINIILIVLPSIMFIVSMSDVIHLVSRYLDALRTEENNFAAIKLAVKEVGLATLLTSITTAIGFFSLYFVRVQPIQVFGVVMGIGVLVAFLLTFLTLPALFYIAPGPKFVRENKKDHYWLKYLRNWFVTVLKYRKRVLIAGLAVVVISLIGTFQMTSNNFIMDDLDPNEPLKLDFDYLDKHYGGVRPFEMSVTVKDSTKNVWDLDVLNQVDSLQQYIQNVYKAEVKTSLVSTLKVFNRSANSGSREFFELPSSKRKIRKYRRFLRMAGGGKFIRTFVDSTENVMRISGSLPDVGNIEISKRNVKLEKYISEFEKSGLVDYQVTGTAHLIDKNISYLSSSLVMGLALSILIVALIIGLIYRSVPILIISIVPNVLPLIFIAGIMGYTGIELKTTTAIIFTIAFGIAVDDTIHFLGKFKYELMKGHSKLYALKRSYLTTGKAMILTTLILCAGFLLLVFSSFLGTYYMGLMLCITLFVALVADLTLLPVLLLYFYNPKKKKKG
ncbi:MAG: efflux RND transporter permease subunit [Crocinitomicaceae bacterium]|nr:efflux RND transporter permease subunit [Crocinitomicaceae bacterium]